MATQPAPDETVRALADTQLMVNVVTAYEKVRFRLTAGHLRVDWPETVLGVIPFRRLHLTVPLPELTSMRLVRVVFPTRLAVVALVAFCLYAFDMPPVGVAILMLVAVLFVLLSFVNAVEITREGDRLTIPVCWLQRRRAGDFIAVVESVVADRDSG